MVNCRFIFLVMMLNAANFGIEFMYSIVLKNFVFKYDYTVKTVIEGVLGPLIGIIVQIIVGSWSDYNTEMKWGKRRPFMLAGNFIVFLGIILQTVMAVCYVVTGDRTEETLSFSEISQKWEFWGYLVSLICFFVGINTLQVSLRTLVLDIIPMEHQFQCAVMFIALSSLAHLTTDTVFTIPGLSYSLDNIESLSQANTKSLACMFIISLFLVPLTTTVTFCTATESYVENKKMKFGEFVKKEVRAVFEINWKRIFNWLILFWGYTAFECFEQESHLLYEYFGVSYSSEIIQLNRVTPSFVYQIQQIVTDISQIGYCVFMFPKRDYHWFLLGVTTVITGMASLLPLTIISNLFYSGIEYTQYTVIILLMILIIIVFIPVGITVAQLSTIPFALLKGIVPSAHFGLFVGILNIAVLFAQFLVRCVVVYPLHKGMGNDIDKAHNQLISIAALTLILYIIASIFSFAMKFVASPNHKVEQSTEIEMDEE
ncbi:hypothetical protein EIN_424370 [Entamoeba invadens IP1]|uniref:Uncharacterized protein n=1 Tax=Entamoeba invadens IP1 TaxID=370355 RepID=A0A0A1U603_ENTIV|nr:hypothetical protein EIN_424370 [Entamoeba invadens IP1]ELP89755.1 hypothetical protein EIN_424370 [Entamoeba invadens IP1]|eukprot:XP_004256526.1 hypothetical protein EIN_424370 [Entamoeba invadens IP1]